MDKVSKARSGSWEGATLDTQEHQCRMWWRRTAVRREEGGERVEGPAEQRLGKKRSMYCQPFPLWY
jgi:hypothetical protein